MAKLELKYGLSPISGYIRGIAINLKRLRSFEYGFHYGAPKT